MKKIIWLFLIAICSVSQFSASAQTNTTLSDKIDLSRLGGTTRSASSSYGIRPAAPIVEAFNAQNVISLSVQNYRGGVWVEVIAPREIRQSYIEVYDMGFGVVNLAGLRAGQYTLRITVGSEIYTGTFKIASYGR